MWCTEFNCKNNNYNSESVCSFFTFPKTVNKRLLKQWILFCKRKDKFNWKIAKICCKHFVKEDFVNYLQYEMGLADRLQLKPRSVPTIYITCEDEIKESERNERMNARKNKDMVCNLLEQTNVLENETTQCEVPADVEPEEDGKLKYDEMSSINYKIQLEIDHPNTEMNNLKSENVRLLEAEISYNLEIDNLKKELTTSEFHRENLEN